MDLHSEGNGTQHLLKRRAAERVHPRAIDVHPSFFIIGLQLGQYIETLLGKKSCAHIL